MERQYIEFDAPDHALVLSDELGAPGDDEVLISVHHAGINRADLLQRLGLYPPPPDASPVPGLEVAGNIVAVGKNVSNWRQGDRVCALTHGGGYASLALARGDHCLALPDTLSTEVGAALPEALLTVWYNLFQRAALTSGETVLIQGGSSGIGSVGIQMAKAMGCIALSTATARKKTKRRSGKAVPVRAADVRFPHWKRCLPRSRLFGRCRRVGQELQQRLTLPQIASDGEHTLEHVPGRRRVDELGRSRHWDAQVVQLCRRRSRD